MEADQYFEKMEAYLRGKLPADEANAFQAEVAKNKELQAMLLRHRLANQAIELEHDEYLREKMQAVREQYGPLTKPQTKVIGLRQWMTRAAAILLVVVGGSGGYAYLSHSDGALIRTYYLPATSPSTARGDAETGQWFAQGLYLYYQEKDYAGALQSFAAVESDNKDYLAARYFMAHCQLQTDQPREALTEFNRMMTERKIPPFVEQEEVEWNRILCYLRLEEDENAQQALQAILQNANYSVEMKTRAEKLNQKLGSFWRKII